MLNSKKKNKQLQQKQNKQKNKTKQTKKKKKKKERKNMTDVGFTHFCKKTLFRLSHYFILSEEAKTNCDFFFRKVHENNCCKYFSYVSKVILPGDSEAIFLHKAANRCRRFREKMLFFKV